MVAQTKSFYMTPGEYLRRERDAETKSEYFDGVVVAMAGASLEHNLITANVITQLNGHLRRRGCIPFASDLRVHVEACNRYFYPDTTLVCGEPIRQNLEGMHSLQNPALIVEVLSDTTEALDRGGKWHCYQTLDSLTTYVLIAQHAARVEVFTRIEGGDWRLSTFHGLDRSVLLPAFGVEIPMAEIYADVRFPERTSGVNSA